MQIMLNAPEKGHWPLLETEDFSGMGDPQDESH